VTSFDWFFVAAYLILSFGIALYFYQRAGEDTSEFFLSGRAMPWWLAGTSMVATTFAVDTPLLVTEIVAQNGIAGNWLWWNAAIGGMLTVFFFARLWRRSGVMTDVEFVEFRYSGRVAAWLRGLKALFFGLLLNILIIGWVSLAMETVIDRLFPDLTLFGQAAFSVLGREMSAALVVTGGLILLVAVYALLSGLWGVMVTDLFQFVVAMGGTIALAVLVLDMPEIGGVAGLREQLPDETFNLLPTIGGAAEGAATFSLSALAFAAYAGVQWWASWYPGAEPGGGGYIAQRMMSAKDEPNALFATLWYTIAHFCLRPWPWIIVALAALVLYPDLDEPRAGFVLVMKDVLPPGLLGLLFASFLAAFMSTVSTQLNWGVSYLVNDFWGRFVRPDADEAHYVRVSRVLTFGVALLSLVVTLFLDTIAEAWGLLLSASAGLALVLVARKCVERDGGHPGPDRADRDGPRAQRVWGAGAGPAGGLSPEPLLGGRVYDGRLARGHLPHAPDRRGDARCVLPDGPSRRARLDARGGAAPRRDAGFRARAARARLARGGRARVQHPLRHRVSHSGVDALGRRLHRGRADGGGVPVAGPAAGRDLAD